MSETGHAKNLEQFKRLKNFMGGWGARYNPTNTAIKTANVAAVATAAENILADLRDAIVPRRNAAAQREDVFAPVKSLVTRVVEMLEASGIADSVVEDARTYSRKVQGRRREAAPKDNPETALDESAGAHSASQQSYTQIVEAFDNLVAVVANQPLYAPNENDLKTADLLALSAAMHAANDAVIAADTAYSNALAARDAIFYADGTGLYDIAMTVKKYVRAAFGLDSAEYNQIRSLEFRSRRPH